VPPSPARPVDALDTAILRMFATEPRIGVLEVSRRLQVARGTVQSRLDRMSSDGVLRGFGPEVDPAALGWPVTAFLTLQIRQAGGHDAVSGHLSGIAEVLEAHTITGSGDVWCRVVARSNTDLQRVIDAVVAFELVDRVSTVIALATQIHPRVVPLLGITAPAQGS